MGFDVTEVQKDLKGVDHPADRDALAEYAERNGGTPELVDALPGVGRADGPNKVTQDLKGELSG